MRKAPLRKRIIYAAKLLLGTGAPNLMFGYQLYHSDIFAFAPPGHRPWLWVPLFARGVAAAVALACRTPDGLGVQIKLR